MPNGPRLTRQSTAPSLPLASSHAARTAPGPRAAWAGSGRGLLQLLLEEPGWNVVLPAVDLLMLCAAVAAALGGVGALAHLPPASAPLLAMPALTMGTLYLRGLYRSRLRALVLDGLAPAVSAVSVAAMAVAAIGLLASGRSRTSRSGWQRGRSRWSRSARAARRWRSRSGGRAGGG